MNMRDTLQKVDDALRDSVIQQFAPKNRAPIPTANATPRRSPEEVASELRGVFQQAATNGMLSDDTIDSPVREAITSAKRIAAPPDFGAQAAQQITESAEHAFKDISHAIEMLNAMRDALARDATALADRIKEFTRISGAISRAFKEFTSDASNASNGGSHVKETPKG